MAAVKRYEWKSDSGEIKQSNAQRTQDCCVNTPLLNAVKELLCQPERCAHFPERSLQRGFSVKSYVTFSTASLKSLATARTFWKLLHYFFIQQDFSAAKLCNKNSPTTLVLHWQLQRALQNWNCCLMHTGYSWTCFSHLPCLEYQATLSPYGHSSVSANTCAHCWRLCLPGTEGQHPGTAMQVYDT